MVVLHVIARGRDGRRVFHNDEDFLHYLALVGRFNRELGVVLHRHCLIPNHAHLLVTAPSIDAARESDRRRRIAYARWHKRCYGPAQKERFWQRGFYGRRVDPQGYEAAAAYVENNAVGHEMVDDAVLWPWCSAPYYKLGMPMGLITPDAYGALRPDVRRMQKMVRGMRLLESETPRQPAV